MTQELPLEDKVPAPTSKHPGGDGRADRPRSSQPVSPSGLLTTCPLLVLRSAPTPTSSLQTPASASSMTTTGMMASRGFSGVPVEADVSPSTGFPRSTAGTRTARGSSSHLGCLNPHPAWCFSVETLHGPVWRSGLSSDSCWTLPSSLLILNIYCSAWPMLGPQKCLLNE